MTNVMERPATETGAEVQEKIEAAEVHAVAVERLRNIDESLAELVLRRQAVVYEVGRAKRVLGLPVFNGAREGEVMQRFVDTAEASGVNRPAAQHTITALVLEARRQQATPPDGLAPSIDAEQAAETLQSARMQINEIDIALAQLLGERLCTAEAMRESAVASGKTGYSTNSETEQINNFGELVAAGGVDELWARRLITPYVATVLA